MSFTAVGPGRPVEWVTSSPLSPTLRSLPPEGNEHAEPGGQTSAKKPLLRVVSGKSVAVLGAFTVYLDFCFLNCPE